MTTRLSWAGVEPDPVARDVLPANGLSALAVVLGQLLQVHYRTALSAGASSVVLAAGDGRVIRLGRCDLAEPPTLRDVMKHMARSRVTRRLAAKRYEFCGSRVDGLGRTRGRLQVIDPSAIRLLRLAAGPWGSF